MAQYPSAVKTFTAKSSGDTIQPAHINDLQDEVTALEDGLLNGTAPINSSRITAPSAQFGNCTISSLSVTSFNFPTNSTLTNVNVTGGSTFAGLNVTGFSSLSDVRIASNPPAARVYQSALTNIGSGSTTRLTFNSQEFVSTTGMHSTTTNPSRVTLVSSGVWMIAGSVSWSVGSTAGDRLCRLVLNGASVLAANRVSAVTVADVTEQSVSAIVRAASSGSYVELEVYQNSGSTCSLAVTDNVPSLSAALLR